MKHRTLLSLAALLACVPLLGANEGCSPSPNPERADTRTVNMQQSQYSKAQPLPFFDFSLERDVAIQLYKARNQEVATHTVWRSDLGNVEGDCPSIGYPLPYDTSLTNPVKAQWSGGASGRAGATVEQAEPNGLYSSKNSIATWVRCVIDGRQVPVYVESKVTAYPMPVAVDYETGRVVPLDQLPSVTLKSR